MKKWNFNIFLVFSPLRRPQQDPFDVPSREEWGKRVLWGRGEDGELEWCELTFLVHQPNQPTNQAINQTKPTNKPKKPTKPNQTNLTSILAQLLKCWSCSQVACPLQWCHVPARWTYSINGTICKTFEHILETAPCANIDFENPLIDECLHISLFWGRFCHQIVIHSLLSNKIIYFPLPQNWKHFNSTFKKNGMIFTFQTWKSLLPGSWWSAGLHSTQNRFIVSSILYWRSHFTPSWLLRKDFRSESGSILKVGDSWRKKEKHVSDEN